MLTVGTTTYLGGDFTSVRPSGAAAGTGEVPRAHLAAVDSATGALVSAWNPGSNGSVNALAVSPDGKILYVGGNFTTVGTSNRRNMAALNAATGAVTAFRADTAGVVKALAASADRVYLGGTVTAVNGQTRNRLAAVGLTGTLTAWQPSANSTVRAITLSPDGLSVYVGGDFGTINGISGQKRLVRLSVSTGAPQAWASHPGYPVAKIVVDPTHVYVGGNGSGRHAALYSTAGARLWVVQTDGGVQGIALLAGVLYIGGHFSNVCVGNTAGATTGFTCQSNKAVRHKILAVDASNGDLDPWNGGADSSFGVFALDTAGGRLRVGGEFTVLGGRAQQGYGSFS